MAEGCGLGEGEMTQQDWIKAFQFHEAKIERVESLTDVIEALRMATLAILNERMDALREQRVEGK
jgi:hypothetical protein